MVKHIFFLILFAVILLGLVIIKLPETHHKDNRKPVPLWGLLLQLLQDKKVLAYGLIVAGCNGILFSYFAEGSFFLIKCLGLSPSHYGFSFTMIAAATMLGGVLSRKLHAHHSSKMIMRYGLQIIAAATVFFSAFVLANFLILPFPTFFMIAIAIVSQMCIAFGICMATSNALALSLVDYKHAIGTASSLFGFFYYCLISLCTLGMGILHNGTLLPMPLYFLALSVAMIVVDKAMLSEHAHSA